jgi:hypothetical protein
MKSRFFSDKACARRIRETDVDHEVDDVVDEPAHEGRCDAEGRRDSCCEGGSRYAQQQRPTRADDDLREDVAPLIGRAEEVLP